jgi:hypothetical protein
VLADIQVGAAEDLEGVAAERLAGDHPRRGRHRGLGHAAVALPWQSVDEPVGGVQQLIGRAGAVSPRVCLHRGHLLSVLRTMMHQLADIIRLPAVPAVLERPFR